MLILIINKLESVYKLIEIGNKERKFKCSKIWASDVKSESKTKRIKKQKKESRWLNAIKNKQTTNSDDKWHMKPTKNTSNQKTERKKEQ